MKNNAKKTIITFFLFLAIFIAKAQQNSIPKVIDEKYYEYSGLAVLTVSGKILLLTQYPEKFDNTFITIDSQNIKCKDGQEVTVSGYSNIKIVGFDERDYKGYQGFEAIAVAGDKVFFAIETGDTSDYCYIIGGIIDRNTDKITIQDNKLPLLKPKKNESFYNITNCGFESLTYLPQKNQLLAVFEYNGPDVLTTTSGYLFDLDLSPISITPLTFVGLPGRLTDITYLDGNTLLGINQYWKGNYEEGYLPDASFTCKDKNGTMQSTSKDRCYARIVKLIVNDQKITIKKMEDFNRIISCDCDSTNWEGITKWNDGVLLISDTNKMKSLKLKFLYKRIPR